jgi:TetR/AcrR family transcriptional regulator, cholesterol catabolism regulator
MITAPTRKDQIYSAAEQLFSQRGYHATTIREIAALLQLEGGSLYSHISGKQDLLYEIVLRASARFRQAARETAEAERTAGDRLRMFMRRHLAIVAESTARAAVYFHEWRHLDAEHRATIMRHRDEYEDYLRRIIRAGIDDGEFAATDPRLVARQVLSLLNWTYQWYRQDGPLAAEELADHFYETLMCGLAPRDDRATAVEQEGAACTD